jgi:hypothetical protein
MGLVGMVMSKKFLTTGERQALARPIAEKFESYYEIEEYLLPTWHCEEEELEMVFINWLGGDLEDDSPMVQRMFDWHRECSM